MPAKNGNNVPKNDNTKQMFCLGASAAVGGLLAVCSDIMQKQDASAVEQLTSGLGLVGLRVEGWLVALVLIGLAVALSFIFSAPSNPKALGVGASILAVMLTAVPYKPVPNLDTAPASAGKAAADTGWWERWLIPPQVFAQTAQPSGQSYPVTVQLNTRDGKPIDVAIYTLFDPSTGQVIGRSRVQGSAYKFYVSNLAYGLRVQVEGYNIVQYPLKSLPSPITLEPSGVPLALQRLVRR